MTDPVLLQVERLSVGFRRQDQVQLVVHDIELNLARGQTLALVGESGCGKTVTALALLGLLPRRAAVSGRVFWRGIDLLALPIRKQRSFLGRGLAMVLQEPSTSLNPVVPVGEQVAESLRYHLGLDRREAWSRAIELLRDMRVQDPETYARAYPHQLSGGERQRALLAAALAGNPELLVADEPTTALDVTVQAEIIRLLARIGQQRRLAILFITHDLALAAGFASQVAVMYAGRLVETGPAAEVITAPAHPYTRALVEALPELWPAGRPLPELPGLPPGPGEASAGCVFAARCPSARPVCRNRAPDMLALAPGRRVACLADVAGPLLRRKVVP